MHLFIFTVKPEMVVVSCPFAFTRFGNDRLTVGAVVYNIFHFKGTAVAIGLYGLAKENRKLMLIGIILLAHATMDRAIGTGLKYFDGFWHTSLSTESFL